ncbi:hypothetical protein L7F22_067565 [Adiantum nelumboides]|nr:hypothetical protein [Adiantum nelumboides]
MADNNEESRINVDSFDFANEGASEETPMLVNYLITRLQQAMANPTLQGEVQQQLQAYGFIPPHQEERIPEKSLGETSKRGIPKVREGENPYEELQNLLLDDTHQSRRRGHAQRQEPPSKEKERSESPDESMEEDVAPRRRRVQRSPTPTKRKRSPHSSSCGVVRNAALVLFEPPNDTDGMFGERLDVYLKNIVVVTPGPNLNGYAGRRLRSLSSGYSQHLQTTQVAIEGGAFGYKRPLLRTCVAMVGDGGLFEVVTAVVMAAVPAAFMAAPSAATEFAVDLVGVIAVGFGYGVLFVFFLATLLARPSHGIDLHELLAHFKPQGGAKAKDEDALYDYEMVWDAKGSMHLMRTPSGHGGYKSTNQSVARSTALAQSVIKLPPVL